MVYDLRFDGSADTGAWERMIHDVFGDVELTIPDRAAFKGIIRSAPVGPIEINTVRCSYEDARRTKAQAARSSEASFALSFVQRGELTLEQFDRICTVGPGSFVLFDLSAPYAYKHAGWTDVLSIKLPQELLETRLGRCQGRVARAGRADRGIVCVTQESLASLAREAAHVPAHLAQHCAAGMLDLIAIALDSEHCSGMPIGNAVSRTEIFRRALAYIDANIRDRDLDVARIAAAHRISVRYLHQIFQENGRSVRRCRPLAPPGAVPSGSLGGSRPGRSDQGNRLPRWLSQPLAFRDGVSAGIRHVAHGPPAGECEPIRLRHSDVSRRARSVNRSALTSQTG